ncbi:MAG TPA: tetratricopeptide repeat protein [Chthoniobacteraceae bacterium]
MRLSKKAPKQKSRGTKAALSQREAASSSPKYPARWWIFAGLVVLLGLIIYHPVRGYQFLNFDDDIFLWDNPWLKPEAGWSSLRWAFLANLTEVSKQAEYWSPLTLLSRLLDAKLYGVEAGPFHVTNAILHLLNALLLGAALFRLTGRWERSMAVALLFLVHPLNVEPVCWLSARKDLLSATFFFGTLLAYARYAERPDRRRYLWLLGAFCACLMSKPMGVTLPIVLLLLDAWPLSRWPDLEQGRAIRSFPRKLLLEKAPLFGLAILVAALAVISQKNWGAMHDTESFPLSWRIGNSLVSYVTYLRRVIWPSDLAIYYPHPRGALPLWDPCAAVVLLVGLTILAYFSRKRAPYLLVGWLWFGVVLLPVIGLIQIGGQAMADRYAYTSVIGVFIGFVWGVADLLPERKYALTFAGAAAVLGLTIGSRRQVTYWQDSFTVFSRALAVTERNLTAHLNLGLAYVADQRYPEAREQYLAALDILQTRAATWLNLGTVEAHLGDEDAALNDYLTASQLDAASPMPLLGAARIYLARHRDDLAEPCLRRVLEIDSSWREPYVRLGEIYARQNRWKDAVGLLETYLGHYPDDETGRHALAEARTKLAAPGEGASP